MFIGNDGRYHEECGVFGIYAPGLDVANLAYIGLFALQHRGQEGAGIAVSKEKEIIYHKDTGLVAEVFEANEIEKLKGNLAIGHVRYSTTGANCSLNTQPVVRRFAGGMLALAHNGNLANTEEIRKRLENKGAVFTTTTDTEVVVNLLASYNDKPLEDALLLVMEELRGSYAFVVLNQDKLYVARDPNGNRPLCLGKLEDGQYVVASESCALTSVGAKFIRDVKPGEVLVIDENGIKSHMSDVSFTKRTAHCIFEYVYFARPDSTLDGINVHISRYKMGEILAREIEKLNVDKVISVPDSGTTAAIGFAEAQGQLFTQGILRNRYSGRTFIQPTQHLREKMVNLKLNPIDAEISGQRIAVVDDSIVRGTTSKKLVERLRNHGAKEVHFLVTCPPVCYPCYYGIDTGERDTLIGANYSVEEIRQYIGADSLNYLSLEGLKEAVGGENRFCTACLDGDYQMGTPED